MFLKQAIGLAGKRLLPSAAIRSTTSDYASFARGRLSLSVNAYRQRKPLDLKDSVVQDAAKARFKEFDLANRVAIVTGGAQGLGLAMAEVLVEAGGHGKPTILMEFLFCSNAMFDANHRLKVYCLDRTAEPSMDFLAAQQRAPTDFGGSLNYDCVDVTNVSQLNEVVSKIAAKHNGINGLIAAAGIQQVTPAIDYTVEDINKMMSVNYTGVFMSAQAVAKQMIEYKCPGSLVLIASISGTVANHGM